MMCIRKMFLFRIPNFAVNMKQISTRKECLWRICISRSLSSAITGLSNDQANRACAEPDMATKNYIMQQTMYRIKDPKLSLDFYTRIMGMRLLQKLDFADMKFSLYFLGYEPANSIPKDKMVRLRWTFTRKATIELTHNWGTETDAGFKYHNGNAEPRGYGHIGIMVPDVDTACQRFEALGVKFVKKPNDGTMTGIAFIQDPDGYWIEILNCDTVSSGN